MPGTLKQLRLAGRPVLVRLAPSAWTGHPCHSSCPLEITPCCSLALPLAQDGTHDALSDHDSYIEDMMAAGEPDPDHSGHGVHGKHGGGDLEGGEADAAELALAGKASAVKPVHGSLHLLAAAPAATLAAAARGAYCAASSHLRALAASFTAYLARIVPAGAEVAQHVARGVAELVGTLQVRTRPAPWQPRGSC